MKLDVDALKDLLKIPVLFFDEIDSTSLYCKRILKERNSFEGLVIASSQSNGQGRIGKSFYSPKDSGLYLTFCLRSDKLKFENLTPAVALAVCRSVETVFGVNCGVKWVNDIYVSDRKAGGILCQSLVDHILIGIGINLEKPLAIPEELSDRMGWITDHADSSKRAALICSMYENIFLCAQSDTSTILQEFRNRCVHIGKRVEIEQNNEKITGICKGIDDDFSLLVEINGKIQSYSSGYMVLSI